MKLYRITEPIRLGGDMTNWWVWCHNLTDANACIKYFGHAELETDPNIIKRETERSKKADSMYKETK